MRYQVGDTVYDRVTDRRAQITHIEEAQGDATVPFSVFTLDPSVPDDPNYPNRHRLASEISPEQPRLSFHELKLVLLESARSLLASLESGSAHLSTIKHQKQRLDIWLAAYIDECTSID